MQNSHKGNAAHSHSKSLGSRRQIVLSFFIPVRRSALSVSLNLHCTSVHSQLTVLLTALDPERQAWCDEDPYRGG
jgi:hypothetical protein